MSSHTPPFIEYSLTLLIVMWCKVTHHPSLSKVSQFYLSVTRKLLSNFLWLLGTIPRTTSYYKACTKSTSQYYFVLQSLHKVFPSTTWYYSQDYFVLQSLHKKHFPVLLCTTKLAQSTSQYYFVLQSLHKVLPALLRTTKLAQKALPSTTLYYKACTKYFPGLLRTTKLARSTSQYYFVLQSLHKVLPSTTLYYKVCTKYFPVLLRTTKLAQKSTSQYYFVQSLHKVFPSTTSYYKACTKYLPRLGVVCTVMAASMCFAYSCTLQLHGVLESLLAKRNIMAAWLLSSCVALCVERCVKCNCNVTQCNCNVQE